MGFAAFVCVHAEFDAQYILGLEALIIMNVHEAGDGLAATVFNQ